MHTGRLFLKRQIAAVPDANQRSLVRWSVCGMWDEREWDCWWETVWLWDGINLRLLKTNEAFLAPSWGSWNGPANTSDHIGACLAATGRSRGLLRSVVVCRAGTLVCAWVNALTACGVK
ncbi:unnamed protein product [Ostreobium quekettii]|uniref:Uncharacterized protein n=1 Tax=Ostreobium quekettii TaxID=121088 RepID=A0A8S1IU46_9CHLO|nr:unnamed protein product [Ostreobium quekettii]